ncbi:restriction endonuclease subunit S [Comamonas sediminis]|uniref:restriction endonuclease subunit S n=1 Tax=Comamonas sediminis TaxID=1783360 RepID=UPI003D2C884A
MSDKNNKTLRPGWRRVKFGDVVRLSKARSQDPLADGIERYVGLEHLEPGDLRIRSWGSVADGVTFTSVFQPGQVLFGKRRAYQRKVAVAEFSGVCSGDIYVLETKDVQALLPELLPFICQTDAFLEHAVGTSAGSLSPRTNWRSLADFEFALPTIDQQVLLVETLKSAGNLVDARKDTLSRLRTLARSKLDLDFSDQSTWERGRIAKIGNVQLGRQRAPKYTTGKFTKPYLRVANVLNGRLDLRDVETMDFNERDFARYSLQPNDILVTEGDLISVYNVGRSAIWDGEIDDCCFQNTLIRFRCGPALNPKFALAAFRHAFYHAIFAKAANATTVAHLGAERFGSIEIGYPDKSRQTVIAEELDNLQAAERELERRLCAEESLLQTIRKEILEGVVA